MRFIWLNWKLISTLYYGMDDSKVPKSYKMEGHNTKCSVMRVTYVREPTEEEVNKIPKWSATSERILGVIKAKCSITNTELSRATSYKLSTINAQISILRRMGLIKDANLGVRNPLATESPNLRSEPNTLFPIDTIINEKRVLYDKFFRQGYDVILAWNNVLEFLKDVPDEIATLVVTSPPYNIGKPYEERIEFKEYLTWQRKVVGECIRILKLEGSICWEIGNYVEEGEVFPLDTFFYDIFKEHGLKLRNRIIWHFGHGLHASKRFSGRYETILWFTKGDRYVFNLDAVRVPQKYPGKRAYKGPNKGKPSANPLGMNPSDVWSIVVQDWEKGIWDIPNVKCNHPEKTIHPSQFPIELVERLVLALTNENDIVFDPFVGVGSSLIASILHNRKAIGVDKEKTYTDIAYRRILDAFEGRLKRRPLGRPIWQPKGTEKVARIPPEWQANPLSEWLR